MLTIQDTSLYYNEIYAYRKKKLLSISTYPKKKKKKI